jgi:hypothetical protein
MEADMFQEFQMIVLIILVWPSSTAFLIIIETLFSNVVQEIRDIAEDSPGRSFGLGSVNGIFLIALTALFMFLSPKLNPFFLSLLLTLLGLFIAAVFIIGLIFGLASMSLLIGDRLFPSHSLFRKRGYAAGITILGCMTPGIGWWGLLPYLLLVGFGAFVIRAYNRFRSSRKKEVEEIK